VPGDMGVMSEEVCRVIAHKIMTDSADRLDRGFAAFFQELHVATGLLFNKHGC
jgi:hypothetical protein